MRRLVKYIFIFEITRVNIKLFTVNSSVNVGLRNLERNLREIWR